jgi:hypothetical protein
VTTENEITGYSGHRHWTMDELAMVQPGLARIMPEVGRRAGILIHAARAKNWPLAHFQLKEIRELMELGSLTRPKYQFDLDEFMEQNLAVIEKAILAEDGAKVEEEFTKAIEQANAYHEKYDKNFLVWKTPDQPPADLDLTPRPKP